MLAWIGLTRANADWHAFWSWEEQALAGIRQMHAERMVQAELIDQFEAAEAWLRPMRP